MNASRPAANGIVGRTSLHLTVPPFGWGSTVSKIWRRQVPGIFHAQRQKNGLASEVFQVLACHLLDNFSKQNEIDVAVDKSCSGRMANFFGFGKKGASDDEAVDASPPPEEAEKKGWW